MKIPIPRGVCTLALVYAALGVSAQAQTGNPTLIRHVRLFDGESVVNDTSVLMQMEKWPQSVQVFASHFAPR